MNPVQIRPIRAIEEVLRVEELQRQVWEITDNTEVVPVHLLVTAAENGGVLLGAFDQASGEMVGFVFSFLGRDETGQLKHCSHMLGVLPALRNGQIGFQLKLAQRQSILQQGIQLVTWTFDPLQSRNAYFNFHKLGGISRHYLPNLYGEMGDGLNAGLPTDRLLLEWHIASQRVRSLLDPKEPGQGVPPTAAQDIEAFSSDPTSTRILRARPLTNGLIHPPGLLPAFQEPTVLVQVPANFPELKRQDLSLAQAWQNYTRGVLETSFQQGYTVLDYLRRGGECYYKLVASTVECYEN